MGFLENLFKEDYSYKKCGVILSSIVSKHENQLILFHFPQCPKSETLREVMDKINPVQGRNTLKLASSGTQKNWDLVFKRKSSCSTIPLSDLLKVD
jgi:DNA polymerase V